MPTTSHPLAEVLTGRYPDIDFAPHPLMPRERPEDEQLCLCVPPDRLLEVMEFLYHDARCRFDQLSDLTCVDYLNFPGARDRYGVVYALVSTSLGHRIWVKCFVNDPDPSVPSVTEIWWGADWPEREVHDLFGVTFSGHPDLRPLMLVEGYGAHPLRKDYPLRGRGEREAFKVVKREDA